MAKTNASDKVQRSARSLDRGHGAIREVTLISNGDMRSAVGVTTWPKQEETLKEVEKAFKMLGVKTYRCHPYKPAEKCGFVKTDVARRTMGRLLG